DNACQHSPPDTRITVHADRPDTTAARIRITDSGPGIPEEVIERAFKPFYTTRKGGTGLGLSIVRRVVEEHGGEVKLYNSERVGEGLTAEVRLPLMIDD
ncbi:MAG: hypothetical protein GF331_00645, partial [Chitinivibrionales bacterium]|nr:hypothetical protein [Chitinivibrionales bacterium]